MTMSELPKDLEEEILCSLPATSLKRLRSTCKPWKRLINGDDDGMRFADKHSDKAPKQFLALMLTKSFRIRPLNVNLHGMIPSVDGMIPPSAERDLSLVDPRSKKSSQFDISRVFHCDGLLLCISKDDSRIVVWNPCTGQTRWIKTASPRKKARDFVLGYYHQDGNKSYKILSFNRYKHDSEIYEFESDSWRTLDSGFSSAGWSLRSCDQGVSFKGKTYMIAKNELETQSMLRFDFATEKSQPLPLPYHQCPRHETAVLSVVRQDKLSVLLQLEVTSTTEIWVTNKIDDETNLVSWTKVLALDLSPDLRMPDHGSFLLDEDKRAVMFCQRWEDPDDYNSSTDKVYIVGEDILTLEHFGSDAVDNGCWPAIFYYVPSLAQIKRARSKRTRSDYST